MSPTESSPVKFVRYETSGGWVRRIPSSLSCFIASRTFLWRTLRYAFARDTAGLLCVALESGWLIKGPLPSLRVLYAFDLRPQTVMDGGHCCQFKRPRQPGGVGAIYAPRQAPTTGGEVTTAAGLRA